jgi:hypothetical protein
MDAGRQRKRLSRNVPQILRMAKMPTLEYLFAPFAAAFKQQSSAAHKSAGSALAR